MMVHFVGAGPGAPDLITVRGQGLLQAAGMVIYAGSLVNPALLKNCKNGCRLYDSAGMTLDEVIAQMVEGQALGLDVVRLHTGDPAIYGAVREQMDALDRLGIAHQSVPGVSSFLAAAAALSAEFTLPGVSQTLILTRMEGRTAVPTRESIRKLAEIGASMAIFLSLGVIDALVAELRAGYGQNVAVAVVYKASWDDQLILKGHLDTIAAEVKAAGISRTALVLVGNFLESDYELSKLYDAAFSHGFRNAVQ